MKESIAVNNPVDGPPSHVAAKKGKLQGAIKALNVREKPSMDSKVLFVIREGDIITFSNIDDKKWLKTSYPIEGFVMSKYIVEISGDTS